MTTTQTTEITHRGAPKGSDPLAKTIRNAIRSAAEQGCSVFVSAVHAGYHIDTAAPAYTGRFYQIDADGRMWLVEA